METNKSLKLFRELKAELNDVKGIEFNEEEEFMGYIIGRVIRKYKLREIELELCLYSTSKRPFTTKLYGNEVFYKHPKSIKKNIELQVASAKELIDIEIAERKKDKEDLSKLKALSKKLKENLIMNKVDTSFKAITTNTTYITLNDDDTFKVEIKFEQNSNDNMDVLTLFNLHRLD